MVSHRLPARSTSIGLALMLWGIVLLGAAPGSLAADAVSVTTPYPGVAAAPGRRSRSTSRSRPRPRAGWTGAARGPAGWNATMRGGGFVVDSVQTQGTTPPRSRSTSGPRGRNRGHQRIAVVATSGGATTRSRSTSG